jgi:hypothetical protein
VKYKPISKSLKVALGLVVVCSVLFCGIAALLFWVADPYHLTAPSDQKLMTRFHDHRAAFEELRQMATEDVRYGSFNLHYGEKLSGLRRQKYRQLLSEIRPCLNVMAGVDGVDFDFAWGGGSTIGPDWSKGIEYIPGDYKKSGFELLPDLDQPAALPPGMYVREIEPHWFIFYNYID